MKALHRAYNVLLDLQCPQAEIKLKTIQTADPNLSKDVDCQTERAGPCMSFSVVC